MNKQDLKTLRGQLSLTCGLLLGCAVLAAVIASQRDFAESFLVEKHKLAYREFPRHLRAAADAAAKGALSEAQFSHLSDDQRRQLYEDWIARPEPSRPALPPNLVRLDKSLYLACAERTVVCGSDKQKERALQFLSLANAPQSAGILEKLRQWSRRRNLPELTQRIEATLHSLSPS